MRFQVLLPDDPVERRLAEAEYSAVQSVTALKSSFLDAAKQTTRFIAALDEIDSWNLERDGE